MITNYKSRNLSIVFVLLIHFLNIETNAQSLALDANVSDSKTTEIEKDSTGITKETELSQVELLPATSAEPGVMSELPITNFAAPPCEDCGGDGTGGDGTGGGGTGDGGPAAPPTPNATYSIIKNGCGKVKVKITSGSPPSNVWWFLHSDREKSDAKQFNSNQAELTISSTSTTNLYVSASTSVHGGNWSTHPQNVASLVVNQNAPAVRNMIGEPSGCVGGLDAFGVQNTQSGVKYDLWYSESAGGTYSVIQTMSGNGSNKYFNGVSTIGYYKVTGRYGATYLDCWTNMSGVKSIVQKGFAPAPKAYSTGAQCTPSAQIVSNGYDWPAPTANEDNDSNHQPHGPDTEDGMPNGIVQLFYVGTNPASTSGTNITHAPATVSANGTYYVRTKFSAAAGDVCWSGAVPVVVSNIGSQLVNPLVSISTNECGPKIITLQELPGQRYELSTQHELEDMGEHKYGLLETSFYGNKIKVIKTLECTKETVYPFDAVYVTLNPEPQSISGGGDYSANPEQYNRVIISDTEEEVNYKIYRSEILAETVEGSGSLERSAPLTNGAYTAVAERLVNAAVPSTGVCTIPLSGTVSITDALHLDMNYKKTRSFNVPVLEEHISAVDQNDKIESITYFDGLGRPVQSMVENASPSGQDLVYHTEYDDLGRQQQSFMPYVANYDQEFQSLSQAVIDQHDFYQTATDVAHDSRPYTEVQYDGSPLNRVKSSLGAGEDWHSANKKSSIQYLSNDLADAVINWSVTDGELIASGIYAAKELHKTLVINEDEKQAITFTNKWGQVLLKKIQAPEADGGWAMTYYVYDDYGNLTVVIPPEAVKLVQN